MSNLYVLNREQIKEVESDAVECETSIEEMMEAVGSIIAAFLQEELELSKGDLVVVFAGPGNNGGDGFEAARQLLSAGYKVLVVSLSPLKDLKGLVAKKAKAFNQSGGKIFEYRKANLFSYIASEFGTEPVIIVDALFGTGYTYREGGTDEIIFSELQGLASQFFDDCQVVSIDIPSGLDCDGGKSHPLAIKADFTLSIQAVHQAYLNPETHRNYGDLYIADIALDPDFLGPSNLCQVVNLHALVMKLGTEWPKLFERSAFLHKGDKGHVFIIGGKPGQFGSVRLSGQTALSMGAGLVTLGLLPDDFSMLAPQLIELMASPLKPDLDLSVLLAEKDVLLIGPGMGQTEDRLELLRKVLTVSKNLELPQVVDADALNLISQHSELQALIHENSILTPHPAEAARLLGVSTKDVQSDRKKAVEALRDKFKCTVVLKGAFTLLASPEGETYLIPIASSSLATAGSGDVLSGALAACLAQGASTTAAALFACYCHAITGYHHERIVSDVFGSTALTISQNIHVSAEQILEILSELLDMGELGSGRDLDRLVPFFYSA